MDEFKEGSLVRIKEDGEYIPDKFLGAIGTVILAIEGKSSCKVLVPNVGSIWLVKDDLELVGGK